MRKVGELSVKCVHANISNVGGPLLSFTAVENLIPSTFMNHPNAFFPACLLSVPNHRLVSSPWFIGLLSFNAVYERLGYAGLFVFSCNLNTYGRFMWTLLNSVLHLNICWCSYNRRLSWNRITGSQVTGSPSQRFGSGREFRPGCNSGRDACITKRL